LLEKTRLKATGCNKFASKYCGMRENKNLILIMATAGISEWKFENGGAGFDFLKALNLPSSVYNMLPYIISLVGLAFTAKRSRTPKAEGIPYDKGQR